MAKQPNIGNLSSGFRSSNKLNENFDSIKEAFDKTLSRDGSGPNYMEAELDMNSFRVINLPAPVEDNDAARLIDVLIPPDITGIAETADAALETAAEALETADDALAAANSALGLANNRADLTLSNVVAETSRTNLGVDRGTVVRNLVPNTTTTNNAPAIQAALTAAAATEAKLVTLPQGLFYIDADTIKIPEGVTLRGAGRLQTILKLRANQTSQNKFVIECLSNSRLELLTVDGNSPNHAVNKSHDGVGMIYVQGVICTDVGVNDIRGMGWSANSCHNITYVRCYATFTRRPREIAAPGNVPTGSANGSGFWNGAYTNDSFYGKGQLTYLDCVANNNDLDGLESGSAFVTIRGGFYNDNGKNSVNGNLYGALGAAGIYTGETTITGPGGPYGEGHGFIADGVTCTGNTEAGIDCFLTNASLDKCTLLLNGTGGVNLRGSTNGTITRCAIGNNGKNPHTIPFEASNGNLFMLRAAVSIFGPNIGLVIADNAFYDNDGGLQRSGIYYQLQWPGSSLDRCVFSGNAANGSPDGMSNLSMSGSLPASVTNLTMSDRRGFRTQTNSVSTITLTATPSVVAWSPAFTGDNGGIPNISQIRSERTDDATHVSLELSFYLADMGTATGAIRLTLPVAATADVTKPAVVGLMRNDSNSGPLYAATVGPGDTFARFVRSHDSSTTFITAQYYTITLRYRK